MIHPLKIKFQKRPLLLGAVFFSLLLSAACLIFFFGRDPDRRFEDYTEALFRREVAGNTIFLHFTLQDPAAYGIHDTPISLGQVSTDPEEITAAAENALALLRRHDREKLSDENRLTYDILEHSLSNSLRESAYALYEEPLAPLTGTQAQLPVLLSEYRFSNRDDVETYLKLLDQVPVYFQSILKFEEARSREGLFMSAQSADAVAEECRTFLELGEENYLYSSFRERLRELSLSQEDLEAYCRENAAAVERSVFPAYQDLMNGILALRDTGKNSSGLCHFPEGENYYKILASVETGSDRSVPELQALTRQQLAQDLLDLQEALEAYSGSGDGSISSDLFKPQGEMLSDTNPASILTYLEEKIAGEFPDPPQADTQIKYVQESMQEYLSPAFYLIPAIDNPGENVIYINPGHLGDDISLFTTLAHEGYPGHLYQTTYFAGQDPDPIRSLLDFGGYTEGWATYTEMMSYYYAPMDHDLATLMQKNASILLGLYALADMGIHYDGWSLLDTIAFFRSYGITETDVIEEIYQLILGDPANYLKYYIGYVEFLELKKEAIRRWGDDFSQEKFHKAVLEVGPAPFDLLREYVVGS